MATRRVLSDLLQIRHELIAVHFAFDELGKHIALTPSVLDHLRAVVLSAINPDPRLLERFEKEINELSGYDPFLAFYLRGKELTQAVHTVFRSASIADDKLAALVSNAQEEFQEAFLPHLEEAITHTSRAISWLLWWRTHRLLRNTREPMAEAKQLAARLFALAKNANVPTK